MRSLTDLEADIIFLSDIRLSSNPTNINDLEKLFLNSGHSRYKFKHNSTKNSHGTGILLKCNLDLEIIHDFKDANENMIGIHGRLNGRLVNLLAVYGPNINAQQANFFRNITQFLTDHHNTPTIIGGDWNATFSLENTNNNIDTFSMVGPPSITRSHGLADCCENFLLTDPFRALHPDRRDFTYYPRTRRANRSRIDFFYNK